MTARGQYAHRFAPRGRSAYPFAIMKARSGSGKNGIGAELRTNMTLDDLRAEIDGGHPVICTIQAWPTAENENYVTEWEESHYMIAVSYDADNVYFMDPATRGNYTYIANDEFMMRWHDVDAGQQLQ